MDKIGSVGLCSQRDAVAGELDIMNKLHKLLLTKCSEQWPAHSRYPLSAAGGGWTSCGVEISLDLLRTREGCLAVK